MLKLSIFVYNIRTDLECKTKFNKGVTRDD